MPAPVSSIDTSDFGMPARLAELMGLHRRIGPWFGALYTQVMLVPGSLSRQEHAKIAAVSATAQDCTYLAESQAKWLRLEGVDPEPVTAIGQQRPEATCASARAQALCQIAAKLSSTPTRMGPDDWQPLIHAGVDPLGLLEVAYVVGVSNYMTRLADGFGLSGGQPAIAGETPDPIPSAPLFDKEESEGGGAARRAAPVEGVGVRKRANNEPDGEVSLGWFLRVRAMGAPKDSPYNFGYRSEMGPLLSAHPRIGPAFWALFSEIMFTPGALTRAEREMVAAVAAAAQDCHY